MAEHGSLEVEVEAPLVAAGVRITRPVVIDRRRRAFARLVHHHGRRRLVDDDRRRRLLLVDDRRLLLGRRGLVSRQRLERLDGLPGGGGGLLRGVRTEPATRRAVRVLLGFCYGRNRERRREGNPRACAVPGGEEESLGHELRASDARHDAS